MARLLVHKAGRSVRGQPKNAPGDIIDSRPDDWTWGAREENNTGFMKLDIVGLPVKGFTMQNDALQNPVTLNVMLLDFSDLDNVVPLEDRRFQIHFGQSGISQGDEFVSIPVADLVITDKAGKNTPEKRLTFDADTQEFVRG